MSFRAIITRVLALAVAAPIGGVAVLAATAAPAAASADPASTVVTTGASGFRLTTDMSSLTAGLNLISGELSAKRRTVDWVMQHANRDRGVLTCAPEVYGAVATSVVGFCWDGSGTSSDDNGGSWIPQGITTTRDALGANEYDGHQVVGVSWYRSGQSRLSLVDWDADWADTYRHLLFVEPTNTTYRYKNADTHAGGLMWYGDLLWVADSTNKGFRIFDTRHIYSADTTGFCATSTGRYWDGSYGGYRYCASGYAYIVPQVGWVRLASTSSYLRISTISLDRSTVPDSFVVSEFATPDDDLPQTDEPGSSNRLHPRVVRWDLNSSTRLPATGTASEALSTNIQKMQGVASRYGTWYFASSNGSQPGVLRRWDPSISGGAVRKAGWVIGAESLSYWGGTEDLLWTCTEHAGQRIVIGASINSLPF
ncbi:hypothetical protein ABZS66_55475 [Dactylosporangium sp. NPDC005572]|uniref:hypothetical protein n=1 Tax=Dactylosporangium sp. NPDC005572 TaxID=3156889 RepID=UPI0033B4840B